MTWGWGGRGEGDFVCLVSEVLCDRKERGRVCVKEVGWWYVRNSAWNLLWWEFVRGHGLNHGLCVIIVFSRLYWGRI